MVGVDNSTVQEGINNIRLFNNTNKNFTVNETLFQNKKNITVNSVDDIKVIPANSFTDFKIGVSNKEGSLEMLLKGVFDDGQECGFTETTKGVLKTSNYTSYFSDIDNCEFNIEFPKTVEFTNDSKYINLALQTNTPSSGILRIVSSDGIVSDPITYLDGYDNINKSLLISNLTTNASVDYKVKIYGCEEKIYTTQLIKSEDNNFSEEGSLEIISFPSKLVSLDNYISSSVNILNNSFSNKDIKIQLTDFPNDWNIMLSDNPIEQNSKEIYVVSKNSNKTIYLKIYIPKNYDSNSYEGQLNIYSNDNLIFSNKLTVDKSKSDNDLLSLRMLYDIKKKLDGSYLVDINVFNDSDINKSAEIELYIDGNKVSIDSNNIFIEANNKTNQKINILENNNIENSLVTIKLIDKTNGNILLEESKDIKTKDKGIITALFSFSDTKGIIQSVVLIILIVSLILYIIYSNKKTKIKKIENIKNKEGNTKKITDY
jgi:hypothetical protein